MYKEACMALNSYKYLIDIQYYIAYSMYVNNTI